MKMKNLKIVFRQQFILAPRTGPGDLMEGRQQSSRKNKQASNNNNNNKQQARYDREMRGGPLRNCCRPPPLHSGK